MELSSEKSCCGVLDEGLHSVPQWQATHSSSIREHTGIVGSMMTPSTTKCNTIDFTVEIHVAFHVIFHSSNGCYASSSKNRIHISSQHAAQTTTIRHHILPTS